MSKFMAWTKKHPDLFIIISSILGILVINGFVLIGLSAHFRLVTLIVVSVILIALLILTMVLVLRKAHKEPKVVVYSNEEVNRVKSLNLVIRETKTDVKSLKKVEKVTKIMSMVLTYAFLVLMAFVILVPFYWMIITSFKTNSEIRDGVNGQVTFWPQTFQWANYVVLFKGAKIGDVFEGNTIDGYGHPIITPFEFLDYLKNTLIVGVFSTLGTLITTILAAFAFARLNFKGKETLFSAFLATMMIPGEMMVITNYVTVSTWLDSSFGVFAAMIVPFWVSTFYIFQLRQAFKQIPNELYYAAKVDGKSDWSYLWKVMVPLSMPSLITIFILKLMGAWNSYVWPNLVAPESLRLVTTGLRSYGASADGLPHQGLQMAATVVVTLPLILLFVFFRKYIMRGVGRAGIKG